MTQSPLTPSVPAGDRTSLGLSGGLCCLERPRKEKDQGAQRQGSQNGCPQGEKTSPPRLLPRPPPIRQPPAGPRLGGACEAGPGVGGGGRIRREGMHPPGKSGNSRERRCLPLLAGAGKGAAINRAQARRGEEASGSASRPRLLVASRITPAATLFGYCMTPTLRVRDSQTNSSIVLEQLVQGCFPNPSLPGLRKSPGLLFLLQRAGCISKLRGAEAGRDVKGTSKVSRALRLWQQDAGTGCHRTAVSALHAGPDTYRRRCAL